MTTEGTVSRNQSEISLDDDWDEREAYDEKDFLANILLSSGSRAEILSSFDDQ